MLKISSDYAYYLYIIGEAFHTCAKTAYTADYHFSVYAGTACFDQFIHKGLVGKAVHFQPDMTGLSVLLAAMPAASTTAVLAEQYGADVRFAADIVVSSTLLSIAVLPLWAIVLNTVG